MFFFLSFFMERISYLTVAILLLSLVVLREGIRSWTSENLGCSYGKNILLDSNFNFIPSLKCGEKSYFVIVFMTFFAVFFVSYLFRLLGERAIFSLFFSTAFLFLILDILTYYYQSVNYVSLLILFPMLIFNIIWKEEMV